MTFEYNWSFRFDNKRKNKCFQTVISNQNNIRFYFLNLLINLFLKRIEKLKSIAFQNHIMKDNIVIKIIKGLNILFILR
ncbi:hypothetical protein D3C86_761020 [compost metagenome]